MLRFVLAWATAILTLTSCRRAPNTAPVSTGTAPQSTNEQVFQVKGVVKAVRPYRKEIEIKHDAVPGYMPAMTMPFEVKDTNELIGLEPEQSISFRLLVTDTEGWIDNIRRESSPVAMPVSNAIPVQPIRVVQPLRIGEVLPEYHFTNQLGRFIATTQFKGQALAITFLFTRCPFPTFCPRLANDFEESQGKLLTLPGGPTNWHLLTVSFDPDYDQPPVLKAYAETHHYDPAHWTFATGDVGEVTALGDLFGLAFWHDTTGSITHNLRTAVIDAQGKLQRVFEGKDWNSAELVAEIVKAAEP